MTNEEVDTVTGFIFALTCLLFGALFSSQIIELIKFVFCCCSCCGRRKPSNRGKKNECENGSEGGKRQQRADGRSKREPSIFDVWVAYGLLFSLPHTGAHLFYLGRIVHGSIFVGTLGMFGVGWFVDLFLMPYWVRTSNVRALTNPKISSQRGIARVFRCCYVSTIGISVLWILWCVFLVVRASCRYLCLQLAPTMKLQTLPLHLATIYACYRL